MDIKTKVVHRPIDIKEIGAAFKEGKIIVCKYPNSNSVYARYTPESAERGIGFDEIDYDWYTEEELDIIDNDSIVNLIRTLPIASQHYIFDELDNLMHKDNRASLLETKARLSKR